MYYCATTAADFERHCVGAAFSQNILGPYIPQEDALICPMSQGGAIDASGFDDNGQRYIVYKIVRACIVLPHRISPLTCSTGRQRDWPWWSLW